ncbi:MAG: 4-hydroxy-3-methylbut-2-enyl diphosphate reductase [Patescibacteria group bacterium]
MNFTFTVARTAGFCWGVDRAIKGAEGKLRKAGEKLFVLGHLVHNQVAVSDLERQGIHVVRHMEEARGKVLLITAHGRDPREIKKARAIASDVLDMTCPIVQDQHAAALVLKNEGRAMVLIGTRSHSHPEVEGTIGVLEGAVTVVESRSDVEALPYPRGQAIGVIAQTTFDNDKVDELLRWISERYPATRYISTICDDIARKQMELRERASEFDTVIVIGDRESANATHLAEIALHTLGKTTLFILNEDEIDVSRIAESEKIFVTAGASTPEGSITGVVKKLEEVGGVRF